MRRFLTGRTAWRVHEHVRAGLLIDAQDYYRAFYEAASRARRSILMLGWQFDSDVQLLRGDDVPQGRDPKDFELLTVLDRLSRERPELQVRMLAWDHSLLFTLEREVLQKIVFDIATVDRLQFRTDGTVPLGGSHHQKVAIIDGQVAFMGSADICQDRWDTSAHVPDDPLRVSRKDQPYKPYHEVQAVFAGDAVGSLVELFAHRWEYATGAKLETEQLVVREPAGEDLFASLPLTLPMPVASVGLSRTVPPDEDRSHVHEVRDLYVRAIHRAERMIYIETQYLTSQCVRDALIARMKDTSLPKLDIVMIMPQKPEKLKEEVFIGGTQADVLAEIVAAAIETGHALGIYDVATGSGSDAKSFVYIHAKLMIVDDVFFTMGSANLANRSMTVDSEINATWVAQPGDHELHAAIRRIRVRLLLEHLGEAADVRVVAGRRGLVARLDRVADEGKGRLRHYDLRRELPSAIAKAVSDFAHDYVDPQDGAEPLPPPSAPSLA